MGLGLQLMVTLKLQKLLNMTKRIRNTIPYSSLGQPFGVPQLDANGKIDSSDLNVFNALGGYFSVEIPGIEALQNPNLIDGQSGWFTDANLTSPITSFPGNQYTVPGAGFFFGTLFQGKSTFVDGDTYELNIVVATAANFSNQVFFGNQTLPLVSGLNNFTVVYNDVPTNDWAIQIQFLGSNAGVLDSASVIGVQAAVFPSSGSGPSNEVVQYDSYNITQDTTISGNLYQENSVIIAAVNNPGNDPDNWIHLSGNFDLNRTETSNKILSFVDSSFAVTSGLTSSSTSSLLSVNTAGITIGVLDTTVKGLEFTASQIGVSNPMFYDQDYSTILSANDLSIPNWGMAKSTILGADIGSDLQFRSSNFIQPVCWDGVNDEFELFNLNEFLLDGVGTSLAQTVGTNALQYSFDIGGDISGESILFTGGGNADFTLGLNGNSLNTFAVNANSISFNAFSGSPLTFLTFGGFLLQTQNANAQFRIGNAPGNNATGINFASTPTSGIEIYTGGSNSGMYYRQDYSANGIANFGDRFIADVGTVNAIVSAINIGDLADVSVTTPENNHLLYYEDVSGDWVNRKQKRVVTVPLIRNAQANGTQQPMFIGRNQTWTNSGYAQNNVFPFVVPFDGVITRAIMNCGEVRMNQPPGATNTVGVVFQCRQLEYNNGGSLIGSEFEILLGDNIGNFTGDQQIGSAQGSERSSDVNIPVSVGQRLGVTFEGKFNTTQAQGIDDTALTLIIEEI